MSFHSVVIQKLLSANAHIGRRVTAHHFKIFSEGTRNSVSIIDSDKTLICLRNACNFIGHLARSNARFLFVNTNSLFDEIITQMTQTVGIKNDTTWRLGGFLTNSSSPRKFRGKNKKFNLSAVQAPDCIVIFDTERKSSVIQEANRLQIPVVGLVDSSMPWETYKKITYPVPANDSVEFVYLFCNLITKTILKEQKEATAEKDNKLITAFTNVSDTLVFLHVSRLSISISMLRPKSIITGPQVVVYLFYDLDNSVGEVAEHDIQIDTRSTSEKHVFSYESLQAFPEDISETKQLFEKLVVLKVNGSLGTEVGFNGSKQLKCTMEISNGLTCLDLIIDQIEALNAKYGCNIPLFLLNAAHAHEGILKVLEKHSNKNVHSVTKSYLHLENDDNSEPSSAKGRVNHDEMEVGSLLPSTLLAHKTHPKEEFKEDDIICLPLMGLIAQRCLSSVNLDEVFLSLMNSGKLDVLLSQGKEYILMLTDDNLAHVVDPRVMPKSSELDASNLPPNQEDIPLWMNIYSIGSLVERRAARGLLTISELFDQHFALSVHKSRYLPVKATTDLLLLQSDLYIFKEGTLTRNAARENLADPSIELGPVFKNVNDFRERFKSIPSVIGLNSLKVTGDVWFGTGITLKGKVGIHARPGMEIVIPDGAVLENKIITSQAAAGGVSL
ncbi:hypothetical protein OROGR_030203 [Orobanche gracilis]